MRQTDLALSEAQGKRTALESRLAEMKTRLDNNQEAAERARNDSAKLQSKINTLQIQLNDAQHERKSDLALLENEIKTEKRELQKAQDSLKEANSSVDAANANIASLKDQLAARTTDQQLAVKELAAMQREIDSLKSQQSVLQGSYDATSSKLETAQSERLRLLEEKTNDKTSSDVNIAKLETEIARLKAEALKAQQGICLLYTSPSPRDRG